VQVGKHRFSTGSFCWCLLALAVMALSAGAQTSAPNEWTWLGGDSTLLPVNGLPSNVGWPGVYGALGVPAVTNIPGGRDSAATWTDQSGDLWLFGGFGYDSASGVGDLNDLWEFNTSTQEWTWMGGSNSLPIPQMATGQLGVYGTLGVAAPGNIPGGRKNSVTWIDKKGNLWLFGGEGYGTIGSLTGNIFFNDLWEFNPSTKEWAWMSGDNQTGITDSGHSGVYGTLGRPAAQNVPGGRSSAVSWIDGGGNLWLFSGTGFDSARYSGDLNDLWEFNLSTSQWAWMGGSSTIVPGYGGRPGVYGTLGIPTDANVPGGREGAISWIDSSGNFWLFGGKGYDSGNSDPNNAGYLNDLWEFNPSTNEWTWTGGSSTLPCNDVCGQPGVYGTLGNPSAANIPGAERTRPIGPIAAATSGSLAGWVLPRRVASAFSMTSGSSIPPPTNGRGWAETLRSVPAEVSLTAAGLEYTARWALPQPGTFLEVERWR
jgi:N-acetylneuraminic acid mutarotase